MTYYLRNGSSWNVANKADIDIHDTLPPGTYTVGYDERRGRYFFETIGDFEIKGKIYGDTNATAERILNTFKERPSSTGVMLSGEKGGGKTLLAKRLSLLAMDEQIPTIVINQPWAGEAFNAFIQSIEQAAIVIFDEFEKVYDKEHQEALLTLLDGVYPSKKLFVITCNDKFRVDTHMQNRPGRIFYRLEYTGLEPEFIAEYCNDALNDKQYIEAIQQISILFTSFNFDILKALVEEMNRYDESPQAAMKYLNAKPEFNDYVTYKTTTQLTKDGAPYKPYRFAGSNFRGNPLTSSISIHYYETKDDHDEGDYETVTFRPADLRRVDAESGTFEYTHPQGHLMQMVREKPETVDIWKVL